MLGGPEGRQGTGHVGSEGSALVAGYWTEPTDLGTLLDPALMQFAVRSFRRLRLSRLLLPSEVFPVDRSIGRAYKGPTLPPGLLAPGQEARHGPGTSRRQAHSRRIGEPAAENSVAEPHKVPSGFFERFLRSRPPCKLVGGILVS